MQCTEVKAQIDRVVEGKQAPTRDVEEHIASCQSCRSYAQDLRIASVLRNAPVPPMREGFAELAMEKAWAAKGKHTRVSAVNGKWWVATAASVAIAFGVVFNLPQERVDTQPTQRESVQVVNVAPQTVRQVDLLMVSGEALPNANITVHLDENVGLVGHPNSSKVSWQASLNAGNNQLSLPVQVLKGGGGMIVVEVESSGKRKHMRFELSAKA